MKSFLKTKKSILKTEQRNFILSKNNNLNEECVLGFM